MIKIFICILPQDLKYKGFQQLLDTQGKKRNINLIPVKKLLKKDYFTVTVYLFLMEDDTQYNLSCEAIILQQCFPTQFTIYSKIQSPHFILKYAHLHKGQKIKLHTHTHIRHESLKVKNQIKCSSIFHAQFGRFVIGNIS